MRPTLAPALALLAFTVLSSAAPGGDWPQWRGPQRDGVSRETEWASKGADEALWTAEVGLGYSCVVVADGRAFTLGHAAEPALDTLWCFDALTGEVLWTHEWPAAIWNELHSGGSLASPSVGGDSVYVLGRDGHFFVLRAEDGEVLLQRDLVADFGVKPPKWGFSASPLLLDGEVVLNLGQVFALDATGKETKWASEKSLGDAYSTPVEFTLAGAPRLAVFDGEGLGVLDRTNGELLFLHAWKTQYDVNAATPVVAGEQVFISSGLGRGAALLSFGGEKPAVVWESKVISSGTNGCVLMGEHLYGFDESVLKCVSLAGEERWRARGLGDGCVSGAGDRLLIMSGKGELIVAAADPAAFRELSRQQVLEGGHFWTTPTLAHGFVYCRNSDGKLVCRDHREPAEAEKK